MNDTSTLYEGVTGVARAAPPVAITGMSIGGIGLADWVYITTILYTLLQAGYLVYKMTKKEKKKDNGGE